MATDPNLTDKQFRSAASNKYGEEGYCEIDEDAKISRNTEPDGDEGAYVQAWLWVANEEVREHVQHQDEEEKELQECALRQECAKGSNVAKKPHEMLTKAHTLTCAGCGKVVTTRKWKACRGCQAEVAPCCQGTYLKNGRCGNCRSGLK